MKFDGPLAELIETPEFERLASIRQLGPIYLIYPGGGHSRKLHALEVAFLSMQFAEKLNLSDVEKYYLGCAGLLHDLGHGPYSHSTELLYYEIYKRDHMDFTADIITGKAQFQISEQEKAFVKFDEIPNILKKFDLDPQIIADLICEKYEEQPYLQEIIFGSIDADQLAFLLSDSKFSGVNYGEISLDTLTQFSHIRLLADGKKHFIFDVKALTAIKDMLMARISMYNFYLVDTGLILTEMIIAAVRRAIRLGQIHHFEVYTDDELRFDLQKSADPIVREMAMRIKYRKLFKKSFVLSPFFTKKQREILDFLNKNYDSAINPQLNMKNRRILEKLDRYSTSELKRIIKQRINMPDLPDEYIIISRKALKDVELTEPRLKKARDIPILLEDGRIVKFIELEPFFTLFIENAVPAPYTFFIAAPENLSKRIEIEFNKFLEGQ